MITQCELSCSLMDPKKLSSSGMAERTRSSIFRSAGRTSIAREYGPGLGGFTSIENLQVRLRGHMRSDLFRTGQ